MNEALHIVLAGGEAAGQLFPGLAVAEELLVQHPGIRLTFAGSGKAFEQQHVAAAGFAYRAFASRPFPKRPSDAIAFLTSNFAGFHAARKFLRQEKVELVVGLGGYGSVPLVRAAARLGLPVVLLEQNATMGQATRWLARRANMVCAAFEEIRAQLPSNCKVRVTGNPIRAEFANLEEYEIWKRFEPARSARRILVLGGSGGARQLNQHVPRALYKAAAALNGWEVVHQSGERDHATAVELYQKLGIKATVLPFISNMSRTLLDTDFAISRSGATSLAELAATGVPALLIPHPRARHDYQRKNADVFAAAAAAAVIDPRSVEGRLDDAIAKRVVELTTKVEQRRRMAHAMCRCARPDAARVVARSVLELTRTAAFRLAA